MNEVMHKSLQNAEKQAEGVLKAAVQMVEAQFVPGYAMKNPSIVTAMVKTLNIFVTAEIKSQQQ
ncbi:MAG: hypothetical protein COB09_18830 [Thalassobium sp.]|nr:MAG: hypothetical protein COB09_18830 [Thalassobium sp.]